ncbi:MAG: hypothetical protein P857_1037 [Candidatus Xenolissoclinum pacificiensis L6]|uniref:Uncharacterized protein n=1 Tax=Candidatus Xenolissoclinum pacificiensis L6 TaxID=1401685 RepID=W2V0S3_9RICK|nr:MAG: hypothetical protein P857_1037 [Candidatus Xenolissoclinum pacificiensis L6]
MFAHRFKRHCKNKEIPVQHPPIVQPVIRRQPIIQPVIRHQPIVQPVIPINTRKVLLKNPKVTTYQTTPLIGISNRSRIYYSTLILCTIAIICFNVVCSPFLLFPEVLLLNIAIMLPLLIIAYTYHKSEKDSNNPAVNSKDNSELTSTPDTAKPSLKESQASPIQQGQELQS